jgi:hypothetical protein
LDSLSAVRPPRTDDRGRLAPRHRLQSLEFRRTSRWL